MKKTKRQLISMEEYSKIIDKIGRKKQPVHKTLEEMLDEAGKYKISQ